MTTLTLCGVNPFDWRITRSALSGSERTSDRVVFAGGILLSTFYFVVPGFIVEGYVIIVISSGR